LQDSDLSIQYLLFDGFEDFDSIYLIVDDVDSFENLGMSAPACAMSAMMWIKISISLHNTI